MTSHNWESNPKVAQQKSAVAECLKKTALKNYAAIGVLEEFELSLKIFAKEMPEIFTGAADIYLRSPAVDKARYNSKSVRTEQLSNATTAVLEETAFKYEMDVYNFVLANVLRRRNEF